MIAARCAIEICPVCRRRAIGRSRAVWRRLGVVNRRSCWSAVKPPTPESKTDWAVIAVHGRMLMAYVLICISVLPGFSWLFPTVILTQLLVLFLPNLFDFRQTNVFTDSAALSLGLAASYPQHIG